MYQQIDRQNEFTTKLQTTNNLSIVNDDSTRTGNDDDVPPSLNGRATLDDRGAQSSKPFFNK